MSNTQHPLQTIDRSIFDAMPPAAILDQNGIICDTNHAWRTFGVENDVQITPDMIGVSYLNVCDVASGECIEGSDDAAAGIRAVINGDRDEFNLEYPCHSPTEERWYNMRVTRFHESEELRVLVVHQVITRWKRAEVDLRRLTDELEFRVAERTADLQIANEEIRRFAYIVSHDLRAPLINIQGFSSELRSSLDTITDTITSLLSYVDERKRETLTTMLHEEIPEAFDFIHSAVERMERFINAILRLSRLGRRELHLEVINTDDLIETVLKSLAHQIVDNKIMVALGELPPIVADPMALEQIFGNILANAVQYLDPQRPGSIDIVGERGERETVFRISDNGRGIDDADCHKVFEPFHRAGKPDTPGEGMGLAYVQALVRRHGGRIWFDSKPGSGTMFAFSIRHDLGDVEDNV